MLEASVKPEWSSNSVGCNSIFWRVNAVISKSMNSPRYQPSVLYERISSTISLTITPDPPDFLYIYTPRKSEYTQGLLAGRRIPLASFYCLENANGVSLTGKNGS